MGGQRACSSVGGVGRRTGVGHGRESFCPCLRVVVLGFLVVRRLVWCVEHGVGHGRESFCPCCARRKTFPPNTVTRAANTPRSGPVEPEPHLLVGLSSQQLSGASDPVGPGSGARDASEPMERARPDSPKRKSLSASVPRKRGRAAAGVCRCGTGGISWRSSWSRESGAKCSPSAQPPPVLDRQDPPRCPQVRPTESRGSPDRVH